MRASYVPELGRRFYIVNLLPARQVPRAIRRQAQCSLRPRGAPPRPTASCSRIWRAAHMHRLCRPRGGPPACSRRGGLRQRQPRGRRGCWRRGQSWHWPRGGSPCSPTTPAWAGAGMPAFPYTVTPAGAHPCGTDAGLLGGCLLRQHKLRKANVSACHVARYPSSKLCSATHVLSL